MTTLTPEIARLLCNLVPHMKGRNVIYLSALADDSDTETMEDVIAAALQSTDARTINMLAEKARPAIKRSVEA